MTISKNTIATLLAAAGLATVVVTGAGTFSLAATERTHHAYQSDSRAYNRTYDSRAYNAWASAVPRSEQRPGAWFAHGAPDDPPGSAFQTFGVDQSMGLVR